MSINMNNVCVWANHDIKKANEGLKKLFDRKDKVLDMKSVLHRVLWADASSSPEYFLGKINSEYAIMFSYKGFTKFVPTSDALISIIDVLGLDSAVNHVQIPSKWTIVKPKAIRESFIPEVGTVSSPVSNEHLALLKKLVRYE